MHVRLCLCMVVCIYWWRGQCSYGIYSFRPRGSHWSGVGPYTGNIGMIQADMKKKLYDNMKWSKRPRWARA
jgi:hypothetical protein